MSSACALLRDRGRVVIVGDVQVDVPRAVGIRARGRHPLLALVRPGALRPRVRGARPRLSDRLRPLDRTAQHGRLSRAGGKRTDRCRGSHHGGSPSIGAARRMSGCSRERHSPLGMVLQYGPASTPLARAAPEPRRRRSRSPAEGERDRGRKLRAEDADPERARKAGFDARRDRERQGALGEGGRRPVRVCCERRAMTEAIARSRRGSRRDRDATRVACCPGRGGPTRRQGGVRREAAVPDHRGAGSAPSGRGRARGVRCSSASIDATRRWRLPCEITSGAAVRRSNCTTA